MQDKPQTTLYCTQREYDAWAKEGRDMSHIKVGGAMHIDYPSHDWSQVTSLTTDQQSIEHKIVRNFIRKVERRAEQKMLLTGRLEGSHYAAMKQIYEEEYGERL